MKILSLIFVVFLTGCSLLQPRVVMVDPPQWPEAGQTLKEPCKQLKELDPAKQLNITDILLIVVENYGNYHECSFKKDGWNKWYDQNKQMYEQAIEEAKGKTKK
ncbi:MAG: hypothetical protein EBU90_20110 [Proteobacteria bacterium]|nr:hypothetical protein [Pseudomonadota bacterium]NBP14629.1 hypothetical protein [bacterium]